jgi:uncharacterized protein involved in exopolysaccharide biosynthesis
MIQIPPYPHGGNGHLHGSGRPIGELRVIDVVNMLLRHVPLLVLLPLMVGGLAVALTLMGREYTAKSRFMPKTAQSPGGAARVAAQFGIGLPVGGEGETPDFYAQLLRSPDILLPALTSTFAYVTPRTPAGVGDATLLDILEIQGRNEEERLRNGVEALRNRTSSSADIKTNLVSLTVTAPTGELAVAVNRKLLELVQQFNAEQRQSQAALERRFVEARVKEAEDELRRAEALLKVFIDRNRAFSESPYRTVEFQRLQREVSLRQQIHTSLAQAYETARIEEIRDMPVITLVESPEGMAEKKGSLLLNLLLGLVIGGVLAAGVALTWEFGRLAYLSDPSSYTPLSRLYAGRDRVRPTPTPAIEAR